MKVTVAGTIVIIVVAAVVALVVVVFIVVMVVEKNLFQPTMVVLFSRSGLY